MASRSTRSRSPVVSPKRSWKEVPTQEEHRYYADIRQVTESGRVWREGAQDLVLKLGVPLPMNRPLIRELLKGQYELARSQRRHRFIRDLQDLADSVIEREFVVQELGRRPYTKKSSGGLGSTASTSRDCTTDIRLKTDPKIGRLQAFVDSKDVKEFPPLTASRSSTVVSDTGSCSLALNTGVTEGPKNHLYSCGDPTLGRH